MKKLGILFLTCESVCYSLLFLFLSSHHEFLELLAHRTEENYGLLNAVTSFLQKDGLSYAAILILVLLALCAASYLFAKKKTGRDDLLVSGVTSTYKAKGICCMLLLPAVLFVNLDARIYNIETVLFLVIAQIAVGLLAWIVSQFLPNV